MSTGGGQADEPEVRGMTVVAEITMSLDGFVTGPNDGQGRGLGEGGEPLHNWVMGGPWTYAGGSPFAAAGVDREVLDEAFGAVGAIIIGRRMYDVVDGWGDSSPFDRSVFVVTSRPHRYRVVGKTSYTFVTGGIRDALSQAQQAAGGQDISVGGGAAVIQQFLAEGLVSQLNLHLAPVLLGSGKRLFEDLGRPLPILEQTRVRESPNATHLRYRVQPRG
jgi:dihydrofolate reductase